MKKSAPFLIVGLASLSLGMSFLSLPLTPSRVVPFVSDLKPSLASAGAGSAAAQKKTTSLSENSLQLAYRSYRAIAISA